MNAVASDVSSTAASKPNIEMVKMEDGRTVEFAGKRKLLKESIFTEGQPPTIRLDFRNGRTISFVVPTALAAQFAAHGAEQKLGDETAGTEDVDDMVLDVESLIERLNRGEWTTRREGGGMGGTSVLLKALIELTGKPVEDLKAFLKKISQTDKLALRNDPKIKPIVQRIEDEKNAKATKVDTDALLAQLSAPTTA